MYLDLGSVGERSLTGSYVRKGQAVPRIFNVTQPSKQDECLLEPAFEKLEEEIQAVRQFESVTVATELQAVEKKTAEKPNSLFKDATREASDSFRSVHEELYTLAVAPKGSLLYRKVAIAIFIDFVVAKRALRALDTVSLEVKGGNSQNQSSTKNRRIIQRIARKTFFSQHTAKRRGVKFIC